LGNGEEACGAAFVAFGFEGKVWWWGVAMETGAPGEAGATEGGGEGAIIEVPRVTVPGAFEEPGLGAGGVGGGREDEEELAASVGDVGGEGAGGTGEGARHAGDKGGGVGLACKRDVEIGFGVNGEWGCQIEGVTASEHV
jgi:hypothetical protein